MKVLVTGYPGTGKSSVARELKKRGHNAYDTEGMRGYMHAQDIDTGEKIPIPTPVPRGWFDKVGNYNWDIPRIANLLASHEDVFLCSLADNQQILYDVFDFIFLLTLDDVELENRLRSRMTTNYGKNSGELSDIMTFHRRFEQSLLNLGAIEIKANRGIIEVTDEILSFTDR
ncbi:MAG TPA: AAA family ATPase [Candidatus Saccharimonadales bacterium]|nr:AAA family ATPase [Candidatus Saccharimonadales bacterium]